MRGAGQRDLPASSARPRRTAGRPCAAVPRCPQRRTSTSSVGRPRPIEDPLISLTVTAVVFGVVFLAELPDKTALAGLVLGTRYPGLVRLRRRGRRLPAARHVLAVAAGSVLAPCCRSRSCTRSPACCSWAGAAVLVDEEGRRGRGRSAARGPVLLEGLRSGIHAHPGRRVRRSHADHDRGTSRPATTTRSPSASGGARPVGGGRARHRRRKALMKRVAAGADHEGRRRCSCWASGCGACGRRSPAERFVNVPAGRWRNPRPVLYRRETGGSRPFS